MTVEHFKDIMFKVLLFRPPVGDVWIQQALDAIDINNRDRYRDDMARIHSPTGGRRGVAEPNTINH